MKANLTLHIYARAAKANAAGLHPLYVRITIDGKRTEFSSKRFINPKQWDPKMMKMKGSSEEARTINSYLETIKSKVNQTQIILEYQEEPVTLEKFMNAYVGKKLEKQRTLIPIFQDHNKRVKSLIGVEYSAGTHERYEVSLKHTQDFIQHQYRVQDIALHKINHTFITDYDFYLRTERNCSNNTTVKYIKNFKKIIRICIANGWISQDPFLHYKTKLQEVEREVLTQDELQKLMDKTFSIERLELVRDIFLFSCYTSLAYIDVKQLSEANLVKGIDGQLWISTHRQKTDSPSKIPLLDTAQYIINLSSIIQKSSIWLQFKVLPYFIEGFLGRKL